MNVLENQQPIIDPVLYNSTKVDPNEDGTYRVAHTFIQGGRQIAFIYPRVKIEPDLSIWPVIKGPNPFPFVYEVLPTQSGGLFEMDIQEN